MGWSVKQGSLVAVAAVVVLGTAACDTVEPPAVLDWGHSDGFSVALEDGRFDVHIHDVYAQRRSPAETVLHAGPESHTTIPANPAFAFLGTPGTDVWILPQTPNPDLLWLGWATTEVPYGALQGDALQWRLLGVDGPGSFHIYTTGSTGRPTVVFDSDDGLPDTVTVPAGTHAHGNWAFGAPGQYRVTFQALGTLTDGTPVDSGPVDYTLTVERYECGDVDDTTVDPSTAGAGQTVTVGYTLANCGTDDASLGVDATLTAPPACGGGTTTTPVAPTTLSPGAAAPGSVAVTAPACPGIYEVKVKPTGVPNRYAAVADLEVT